MEHRAAIGAAPAPAEASEDFVVGDLDQQRGGDLGVLFRQGGVERLGLFGGAREAVEQAAELRVFAVEPIEQHRDRQLVRHQLAALHIALRFHPQLRLVADVFAEHVAGGEVEQSGALGEVDGLGAFARAGRTEQDDVGAHRMNPS